MTALPDVQWLMDELDRRYPDKALLIADMTDNERIEYLAKLKLIVEIKTIIEGQNGYTDQTK